MNTPELIMFAGIPASGKSTYSKKYADMGYRVLSIDVIRLDAAGSDDSFLLSKEDRDALNARVIDRVKQESAESLRQGISVVVDATNLIRKKRIDQLKAVEGIPCRKKCMLFITSGAVCLERNSRREGVARVPDWGMEDMFCRFECPCYSEGWDEITVIADPTPYSFPFEDTVDFDQMNPHHARTLHGHLEGARAYAEDHGYSPMLQRVAYFHDIGKLYTRSFKNAKGESCDTAHYYRHENYGAFLYLAHMCCGRELSRDEADAVLYEANLINCHMRPLNVWRGSDKRKEKDVRFFGESFVEDLEKLHEADVASH